MAETLQGTALIIGSRMDPDYQPDPDGSKDDGLFSALLDEASGMLYEFTLEVTVPGHETYQIGGVRSRVPSKASRISLLNSPPVPLTLEVPVVVAANDSENIRIDWRAFIALPDRVTRLKEARERALLIAAQRAAAAQPDKFAALREQNKNTLTSWVASVKAGALSRKDFEQSCQTLIRLGQMDPADYAAAVAQIDGTPE